MADAEYAIRMIALVVWILQHTCRRSVLGKNRKRSRETLEDRIEWAEDTIVTRVVIGGQKRDRLVFFLLGCPPSPLPPPPRLASRMKCSVGGVHFMTRD